jgi:deoxyribodipyrimidine photolyase-related protein
LLAPSEYAAGQAVARWAAQFGLPVQVIADEIGFTTTPDRFKQWAAGKKTLLLEHFYRWQRVRLNLLMEGKNPVGGAWNYDAENRERAATLPQAPPLPVVNKMPAVAACLAETTAEVLRDYPSAFGNATPFVYPVTAGDADAWLADFIGKRLANFGRWEDAIAADDPFLFHSAIALLLNVGLLTPQQVLIAVIAAFEAGGIPIQSAEGFVRQVVGWREFVYGIYWLYMPSYAEKNFFAHREPLPAFFWDAQTEMRCLSQTILSLQKHAYTHHIPRLMLLANFANLAAIDPQQLNHWFLSTFIDAYDWVMWPNVLGLGLYADGGLMATKPYVASAAYIKKMSKGYCPACHYDPNLRTGARACPFNTLYWDFLARNQQLLRGNNRMAIVLKAAQQRPDLAEIRAQAEALRAQWRQGSVEDSEA